MGRKRYRAFISYCHRDAPVAAWLHRALETYAIPAKLVGRATAAGEVPRRLTPIFKDREELPAADSLGAAVDAALGESEALIVLCSPDAARSPWVNREIERFKEIHGGGRVFPALVAGEPDQSFPPVLRVHYENGRPTGAEAEPIAADLRREADGRRLATLKLVAGLTGLELDQLVQRDNQRRQRRLALVAAASLAGMAGTSGLAAYAMQQRDEARSQRAEADGLIEYMLTDLRGKLEPVGKLDVLDGVGRKALDYYARQKLAQLSADELGRRAKAMLLVAEVSDLRGNKDVARDGFEQAARSTAELLQRDPGNWQRVYDHAQSEFWLAYEANNRGDNKAALPHFVAYRDLGKRMLQIAPDKLESKVEAASADVNLGVAMEDERKLDTALSLYSAAAVSFEAIRPRTRDVALNAATAYGHAATILSALGRDGQSIELRHRQRAILAAPPLKQDDREVQEAGAIIASQIAASELTLGNLASFGQWNDRSLAMWRQLLAHDPTNVFWRGENQFALMNQAVVQFRQKPAVAKANMASIVADQQRLWTTSKDKSHAAHLLRMATYWQAMGGGWNGWQDRVVKEFWAARASLDDTQRTLLAAALIAAGDAQRASDPSNAVRDWQRADQLMRSNARSSYDRLIKSVAAQRLGRPAIEGSPNPNISYAGIFGTRAS